MTHKTAGQLSHKALLDNTKYDALEVAYGSTDSVGAQIREAIENYRDKIEELEFCVVMIIAKDPLLTNLKRRKFYCWPWLPAPRPNQAVFLYNKLQDRIKCRLWVLPCADSMAVLATPGFIVDPKYTTMQHWSRSFFKGTFWEDIRSQHKINMLSQEEYFISHREELLKSGVDISKPAVSEAFDFSKISANDVGNPLETAFA